MISADKEEIRIIFEEVYPNNVRERNLELYGQMYTSDALWMPPNAPDRCGIPDILEGFALTIADKYIDPTFTAEEIKVIDDIGYVLGISIANICPMDGSPSTQAHYRALWVMKKEYGSWKIDRQIWNNKPLN